MPIFERYLKRKAPRPSPCDIAIEETTRVRLSLSVSEELNELLNQMAEELGVTKSEILRKGIALLSVTLEGKQKQQSLALIDENGKVVTRIVGI